MNTDELIRHGRARFEHAAAKKLLREKYQAKLTFVSQGGMWSAGPELLNLLSACADRGDQVVIEDLYKNPVRVNVEQLRELAWQRWQECMNAWLTEFDALHATR
jgi:hypothetical protein